MQVIGSIYARDNVTDKQDPVIQMTIAQNTHDDNQEDINKAMSSIDAENEASIQKLASTVQTDEEKSLNVQQMVTDERVRQY